VAALEFRVPVLCGFFLMADEEELDDEMEDENDALDGEGGEDSEKSGSKKVLIIVGVFLLLVVGGFSGAYFTGLLDPVIAWVTGGEMEVEEASEEEKKKALVNAVFFPLEEIIVNLNTGGRKSTFLKVKVNLELADAKDIKRIEAVMPRIMDNFQVYLRELRIEDLKGSAGMYRLREELLTRVNLAVAPAKVNDVLFKEMLVQ
jgi:flagellar FliL protein